MGDELGGSVSFDVDRFLALLTIGALVAMVALLALPAAGRTSTSAARLDAVVRELIHDLGYWLAWLVATASMVGSLYYSEIADFAPCSLCWYQRIAMFPLVVILAVAAWTKDRQVHRYVVPIAVIGATIALYQYVLGFMPDAEILGCSLDVSCTERFLWEFGFIDFPLMSLIAFALVVILVLKAREPGHQENDEES